MPNLRRTLVQKWTRLTMPLRYAYETPAACWCGGNVDFSIGGLADPRPQVGRCDSCGTGVLRRRLTEKSYARFYASGDYRRYVRGSDEVTLGQFLREYRRGLGAITYLEEAGYGIWGQRVLDFGCGAGGVLAVALVAGAKEVVGVDVDPRSAVATRALGIPVEKEPPARVFDRIILSHILEHALRPHMLLSWLAVGHRLAKDGCLYVETPEWTARSEVKLPHPWMFTQGAVAILAERAGLVVEHLKPGVHAILRKT